VGRIPKHKIAENIGEEAQKGGNHSNYFLDSGLAFFFYPSVIPAGGWFASNKEKTFRVKTPQTHPENCLNFKTSGK